MNRVHFYNPGKKIDVQIILNYTNMKNLLMIEKVSSFFLFNFILTQMSTPNSREVATDLLESVKSFVILWYMLVCNIYIT